MSANEATVDAPQASVRTPPEARRDNLIMRWRGQGAFLLLVVLVIAGAIGVDHFATKDNLIDVLQSQAYIGIIAVGMTWVVLSGNFIDLSAPVAVAIGANVILRVAPTSVPLAIILALAIPVVLGVINGFLVARMKLNPVMATLGTAGIAAGCLYLGLDGRTSSGSVQGLTDFASSQPLGVPLPAIAFVLLVVINQIVLTRTRLGANVRFVGNNADAARASGIRPVATVTACFVLSAVLAGVAGILLGASTDIANVGTGKGYEFDALAAIVVGGTLLRGGIGSLWRTLFGVLVIATANNITSLMDLSSEAQLLVKGAMFVAVVAIDAVATRSQKS